MDSPTDEGMLYKLKETLGVFASRRPALGTLLANRASEFEAAHLVVPSDALAGERLRPTIQAWDQCERPVEGFEGAFTVDATDPEATHPERFRFPPEADGVATIPDVRFRTPGVQYLTVTHEGTGERFVSNPVRVAEAPPEEYLFWGDIHLHSHLSDGCGSVEQGMRFGRDVMDLDVVAYTDHDTMGFFIPPRLQRRRMHRRYFDRLKEVTEAFHDPGEFVTLFAYEWTKQPNVGGHINVYFDGVEEAQLFDSHAPDSDTYEKLWARVREFNESHETQAVTVPHHPAESSYPFDFSSTEYDDGVAPLVEIYSQWGNSERPGNAGNDVPVTMGSGEMDEPGYYVQDALAMGHRVGLTASSDYHGPHPGHSLVHTDPHVPPLAEWREQGIGWGLIWQVWNEDSYPGGLQAFYVPELTREAIFESLRSRRVYGTSQPHRIRVDFRVGGVGFGQQDSTVTVDAPDAPREVAVEVAGTAPVAEVTVVKNNDDWRVFEGTEDVGAPLDSYTVERAWTDDAPVAGMDWDDDRGTDADVYYLRLRQADGGRAWAGPVWVETGG